jgi:hypothetical protein
MTHAVLTCRNETLSRQADLFSGTGSAIDSLYNTAFAVQAHILAYSRILPADLCHSRASSAVNTLECPAVLARADVLTNTGILPADFSAAHAYPATLSADWIGAALAAGAVLLTRAASCISAGVVTDKTCIRTIAAEFPVETPIVVDGARENKRAFTPGGVLNGALVLADHSATSLALFHIAHFVEDRAVGRAHPAQASLLSHGADLYNRAVASGVAFLFAGIFAGLGALGGAAGLSAGLVMIRAVNPILPLGAMPVGLRAYLQDCTIAAGVAWVLALVSARNRI